MRKASTETNRFTSSPWQRVTADVAARVEGLESAWRVVCEALTDAGIRPVSASTACTMMGVSIGDHPFFTGTESLAEMAARLGLPRYVVLEDLSRTILPESWEDPDRAWAGSMQGRSRGWRCHGGEEEEDAEPSRQLSAADFASEPEQEALPVYVAPVVVEYASGEDLALAHSALDPAVAQAADADAFAATQAVRCARRPVRAEAEPTNPASRADAAGRDRPSPVGGPGNYGVTSLGSRPFGFRSEETMQCKIELIFVPVADVDRAIDFYVERLGFTLDMQARVDEHTRFVQVTPPSSACSIAFGEGITEMTPGSQNSIQAVVADAREAHRELLERGVVASDVETLAWGSFTSFDDPDGNKWTLQELPPPGSYAQTAGV